MTKKKRRRAAPSIVPRLGPARNLRPAGAHESIKRYNRKKAKLALRKDLAEGDGFFGAAAVRAGAALVGDRRFLW